MAVLLSSLFVVLGLTSVFHNSSWIAATDLEPLPNEKIERGAGSKKAKKLNEAFAEAARGFSLQNVKALQDEVMDLDEEEEVNDEEREIAEPSADEDGMEVDEDEASSDEKPKKKKAARGKKRKKSESASDDEAESEKPAKTPKKASAASKPKTPKSAASKKTTPAPAKAKSSKSPTNGVKTSKKAATVKDKASPPASSKKKATPAKRKSAAKSKEVIESEESEADKSDEQASTDPRSLSAEDQHKYILHRRHKLQKAFLNKDKIPPMEEVSRSLPLILAIADELGNGRVVEVAYVSGGMARHACGSHQGIISVLQHHRWKLISFTGHQNSQGASWNHECRVHHSSREDLHLQGEI